MMCVDVDAFSGETMKLKIVFAESRLSRTTITRGRNMSYVRSQLALQEDDLPDDRHGSTARRAIARQRRFTHVLSRMNSYPIVPSVKYLECRTAGHPEGVQRQRNQESVGASCTLRTG